MSFNATPDLSALRIGYTPFDSAMQHPGDRRRFCHYAKVRQLNFEIAKPGRSYDLVIVTAGGDISVWNRGNRGQHPKIIFELIDSYLAIPKLDPYALFRGLAKFTFRQNRYLLWNYAKGLRQMCQRADAVVCSTLEQRHQILEFCDNVHVILDFQCDEVGTVKKNYEVGDVFNFVWEGMPENLSTFSVIADVLASIRQRRRIAIHAITDLKFGRFLGGKLLSTSTPRYASKFSSDFRLYQWSRTCLASIATSCDLGLIPLPLNNPLYRGKPENKLLLLWRLALPVVVSATPAYRRALAASGLSDMGCDSAEDWERTLLYYMNNEEARRGAAHRGHRYAQTEYSEQKLLKRWDEVLHSVCGFNSPTPRDTSSGLANPPCF